MSNSRVFRIVTVFVVAMLAACNPEAEAPIQNEQSPDSSATSESLPQQQIDAEPRGNQNNPAAATSFPTPCTTDWYSWVEERVGTSDGAGHGPDVGSTEWRYSVVFLMGIEGKAGVPDVDTEEWCTFINETLSRHEDPE